jgi:hypothetical protein
MTTRPLQDRTWLRPADKRIRSRFDSTWSSTLALLDLELRQLAAKEVVLELDVREGSLRLDGGIKANAKLASPAARLSFGSRHGHLMYACDRFVSGGYGYGSGSDWQHNVRAIALTLEADFETAMRAVGR